MGSINMFSTVRPHTGVTLGGLVLGAIFLNGCYADNTTSGVPQTNGVDNDTMDNANTNTNRETQKSDGENSATLDGQGVLLLSDPQDEICLKKYPRTADGIDSQAAIDQVVTDCLESDRCVPVADVQCDCPPGDTCNPDACTLPNLCKGKGTPTDRVCDTAQFTVTRDAAICIATNHGLLEGLSTPTAKLSFQDNFFRVCWIVKNVLYDKKTEKVDASNVTASGTRGGQLFYIDAVTGAILDNLMWTEFINE